MLLIELCLLVCLIAHKTESNIVIVQDYDDMPSYIDYYDERQDSLEDPEPTKHHSDTHKPKKSRKHTVLHYGRHIYHLDSFEDTSKLRSKLKGDYISYDYIDFNKLIRTHNDRADDDVPWDYIENLMLMGPVKTKCKDKKCSDMRKFNNLLKRKGKQNFPDSVEEYLKKRMPLGAMKRFKIVDSGKQSKAYAMKKPLKRKQRERFGRHRGQRKPSISQVRNKKKKTHGDSSSGERQNWSKSEESGEKWTKKRKKKVYDSSSRETDDYKPKKMKKKYEMADSGSYENKWNNYGSNSIEDSFKKTNKKKKRSNKTKRKTFDNNEMYLQGSRLVDANAETVEDDEDKRRRLPQFLPKRYHWEPHEIHDLGYFWFNGPKGRYSHPITLM